MIRHFIWSVLLEFPCPEWLCETERRRIHPCLPRAWVLTLLIGWCQHISKWRIDKRRNSQTPSIFLRVLNTARNFPQCIFSIKCRQNIWTTPQQHFWVIKFLCNVANNFVSVWYNIGNKISNQREEKKRSRIYSVAQNLLGCHRQNVEQLCQYFRFLTRLGLKTRYVP